MKSRSKLTVATMTTALILVFSWVVLFWIGHEPIVWSLTPYDTTPIAKRPPVGTWPRDLNDFFLTSSGKTMPATLITGVSVALFAVALRRLPQSTLARVQLMLLFALSNVAVITALFLSGFIVGSLPLELTPYPGYGWTVKFLIPEVLLLALLFSLQLWGIPKRVTKLSSR